jgi:hypothetical protein
MRRDHSPFTLMPGLLCNDLLHEASIRVRPANVRIQKILARKVLSAFSIVVRPLRPVRQRLDISAELDRRHKSHLLKIYPVIGKTPDDGHSLLYLGIPEWGT